MIQSHFSFDTLRQEVEQIGGLVPRDYQSRAIAEAFHQWDKGTVGVIVRQPMGTGKTIAAIMAGEKWLARGRDHRVMMLCHERQLVHQAAQENQDVTGHAPGIEMGNESIRANHIPRWVIASRQSLISKTDEEGDFRRFDKFDPVRYKWLLIIDELHR